MLLRGELATLVREEKQNLSEERRRFGGQALAETALVIPFLLLLTFGVVGIGRMTQTQMAVSAVAREAARTGALADTADAAKTRGEQRGYDVGTGYKLTSPPLKVTVDKGNFHRCGSVTAHVSYVVNLRDLPMLNWVNTTLSSDHTEPVDGYRNDLTGLCTP